MGLKRPEYYPVRCQQPDLRHHHESTRAWIGMLFPKHKPLLRTGVRDDRGRAEREFIELRGALYGVLFWLP